MSTQETFTARQLEAARKTLWRQDGSALMTLDAARAWIEAAGLVPFMPRTQQLPAPTPSFAEAVLGRPEMGYVVPVKVAAAALSVSGVAEEEGEIEEEEGVEDDLEDAEEDDLDFDDEDEDADDGAELEDADGEDVPDADEDADEVEAAAEAGVAAVAEPVEIINGFTPEQMDTVRGMLARLVASGAAVPLNLLGTINDTPDFVCSAQAFSFVYTLRGDKGWKQAPSTSGAMSVSPLGVNVYAALKEKGPQTAGALVPELGREVTEAAVLRALSELWALERVVPVPQADGSPAVWELMSGRFIRHIKAGANAGQPTALSALLSLYLGAVIAATGEEMEIFLSPLAARSRIREVVGGLSATRQLDATVLDGKTLLHIAGELPAFPSVVEPAKVPEVEQVSRYERPARPSGGKAGYPVRRPAAARAGGVDRPERSERERRPFKRSEAADGGAPKKREYTKPWDDERGPRPAAGDGARKPYVRRESAEGGERKPYQRREGAGGSRPAYGSGERKPFNRTGSFGDRKPYVRRDGAEGGERRPSTPREGGERRPFNRSASFGERKPFVRRDADGGGERRPYVRRDDAGAGERKPYQRREGAGGSRPAYGGSNSDRKPYVRRDAEGGGSRPAYGDRKPYVRRDAEGGGERRPYQRRDASAGGERRPYTPREGGERRPYVRRDAEGGGERRPYVRRDGDAGARPSSGERKPYQRREGAEGGERKPYSRPAGGGGFGGPKKFGSKPGGGGFAGKSGGGFGRKPASGGYRAGGPRKDAGAPRAPRKRPEE